MNLSSSKTVLAALAAAVLSVATPAGAQPPNIRVDIPFSFIAGDQLLRGGEYRIDVDNTRHVFRITSADDGSVSYVRTLPVTTRRSSQEADRPMVRFAKHGEQYVLEGVWERGAIEGNTVVHSRRAMESAKAAPVRDLAAGSN
jgi:hypothetical protein